MQNVRPSRRSHPLAETPTSGALVSRREPDQALRQAERRVRQTPGSANARLTLAGAFIERRDRVGAAQAIATALRLQPANTEAAEWLGALLAVGRLPDGLALDPAGLAAAVTHRRVDRELIGAAALHQLKTIGSLVPILAETRENGPLATARRLLARRSAPLLRDDLFLAILEHCVIADHETEVILTAIRAVALLELPTPRFGERDLGRFLTAVAAQGAGNGYVWVETPEERSAVADSQSKFDIAAAMDGRPEATAYGLKVALYRDPLPNTPATAAVSLQLVAPPTPFSAFLRDRIAEKHALEEKRKYVVRLGAISHPMSIHVKGQYETAPYPHWRGAGRFPFGDYEEYLSTFFGNSDLKPLKKPFDVLIAGCGTGAQAVTAALDYGPFATVTGLDISEQSLAYAALMADRLGAGGLHLVLGDLLAIADVRPDWRGRFQLVECCGVLHHLADPASGWLALLDVLRPDGLMLIGLYSALARRNLAALKADPACPGPAADNTALRTWRDTLFRRPAGAPGEQYLRSRDAFTTSGFRDFFLHRNEHLTTIPEIADVLAANGLVFRGFVSAPFSALQARFPDEVWPGRLELWAELEAEMPDLFLGMYQFWLSRRPVARAT